MFEELELLKEFEKRETTYTKRYSDKKQEKKSMETKVCALNLYGRMYVRSNGVVVRVYIRKRTI